MPGPFDPIEYVQWRTDCTTDQINAWQAALLEQDLEDIEVPSFTEPARVMIPSRRTPPCLGCGRPTGAVFQPALVLKSIDAPTATATFNPCGCQLRVWTPPILDHIPDGTFPFKKTGLPLDGQIAERFADQPELHADFHGRLAQHLGQRPDVVMLLDPQETRARGLHGWALVGYTLHARPGATEWIVVRGDRGMPPGFMPSGLDGRWQERARIPAGLPVMFKGGGSIGTARASGRVEIREDGAVAEVYEMRRP